MPDGRWKKAIDDLLWGPHPRGAGEDGSDRGHAFLIGLLPFGRRAVGCEPQGLTMGNALPSTAATRIEPTAVAAERCW